MVKLCIIAMLFGLAGLAPSVAFAAPVAAGTPPTARISLTRSVGMEKLQDLDFAALRVTSAGTATINPVTDTMATTGGVVRLAGTPQAAQYRITTAGVSLLFLIRLPNSVTLTRLGGAQTMTVNNFTAQGGTIRILQPAGSYEFRVGGRLNVSANQAEGTYLGTFEVTADYF